jgi:ribosome-binding factor A
MLRELSSMLHCHFREESTLLTITCVIIDSDLKHGKVFFSTPDESSQERASQFFRRHKGEIKRILSQRIPIRQFPELHFRYDPSLGRELRVNEIMDSL